MHELRAEMGLTSAFQIMALVIFADGWEGGREQGGLKISQEACLI